MTPTWATPPPARPHRSLLVFLVVGVVVNAGLSTGALIVSLTHRQTAPRYTAAQQATAKKQLCESYKLAARAEHIETNLPDNAALARISATNGALILKAAAADPALEGQYRDAAKALALSYETLVAVSSGKGSDDPQIQAAADDANAKDRILKGLCGS